MRPFLTAPRAPLTQHPTSREDLSALLEDDTYFDAFFNTMPQAREMHQAHERRLRDNIGLAGELSWRKSGREGVLTRARREERGDATGAGGAES